MIEKNLLHRPFDPQKNSDRTLRMAQMAMLIAVSSVLVFVCFPIIPGATFLKYDMADVPILLCTFTMGAPAGLFVLTAAAAIQAFLFGHDGPIGFLMHVVASGTLLLVAYTIYTMFKKNKKGMIIGLICGSVSMALIMIPLNFIFTPKVIMDVPIVDATRIFWDSLFGGYNPTDYSEIVVNAYNAVKALLFVGLIPFNLIKAGLNSILFYLVYRNLPYLLKKKK